jgi:hypothetical protein
MKHRLKTVRPDTVVYRAGTGQFYEPSHPELEEVDLFANGFFDEKKPYYFRHIVLVRGAFWPFWDWTRRFPCTYKWVRTGDVWEPSDENAFDVLTSKQAKEKWLMQSR